MATGKDVRDKDSQIVITLGGRQRTLIYDMNAFYELEKKYGSVEQAMVALEGGSLRDIRTLLWAGIIHEEVSAYDPDTGEPTGYNCTPYQVGSWIKDLGMLQAIAPELVKAITRNLPTEENMGPPAKQAPTKAIKGKQDNKSKGFANVELTPEELAEEKNV